MKKKKKNTKEWTREGIEANVIRIVASQMGEPADVTLDNTLRGDLDLDSIDIMEVLINCESVFGIKTDLDAASDDNGQLETVADVCDMVEQLIDERYE